MKSVVRLAAVLLIACMLSTVIGCTDNRLSTGDRDYTIKVIVKKKDASFWTVVKMGAEAAAKEFGVDVRFDGPTDEKDIDGQIKMVDAAIESNADAIVLAASDYNRLVDVVEKAVLKNIPVVIIDSDINYDKTSGFIGTDNIDAGKVLGRTVIEKVGRDCSIAIMSFVKGAATADQREQGLSEVLKENSSVKVLSTVYCNSDENIAEQLTEKLVRDYPDINAIVCTNAYGTTGTARAIDKLGMSGKVKVIGFDSTPEEVGFVEKDVIQALVIQNPFKMGYLGVKYALDAVNNITPPRNTNTGSNVIDKENMYQPENQKLVFPFTN
jgi:ribose transport system substrate-binding protein